MYADVCHSADKTRGPNSPRLVSVSSSSSFSSFSSRSRGPTSSTLQKRPPAYARAIWWTYWDEMYRHDDDNQYYAGFLSRILVVRCLHGGSALSRDTWRMSAVLYWQHRIFLSILIPNIYNNYPVLYYAMDQSCPKFSSF